MSYFKAIYAYSVLPMKYHLNDQCSCSNAMEKDQEFVWLIEQAHDAYLAWIALWLASALGIVTILVGIISVEGALSMNYLHLIWLLFWALVSGMIFAVSRVVNNVKQNLSWALQINKNSRIRIEAEKIGGLARHFVYVDKNEAEEEKAVTHKFRCVGVYLVHLVFFGFLFLLAVGYPCWTTVTASIIFVVSVLISYGIKQERQKKD